MRRARRAPRLRLRSAVAQPGVHPYSCQQKTQRPTDGQRAGQHEEPGGGPGAGAGQRPRSSFAGNLRPVEERHQSRRRCGGIGGGLWPAFRSGGATMCGREPNPSALRRLSSGWQPGMSRPQSEGEVRPRASEVLAHRRGHRSREGPRSSSGPDGSGPGWGKGPTGPPMSKSSPLHPPGSRGSTAAGHRSGP